MKATLKKGAERREKEATAVDRLVTARNNLNASAQVTDQLTEEYEEA